MSIPIAWFLVLVKVFNFLCFSSLPIQTFQTSQSRLFKSWRQLWIDWVLAMLVIEVLKYRSLHPGPSASSPSIYKKSHPDKPTQYSTLCIYFCKPSAHGNSLDHFPTILNPLLSQIFIFPTFAYFSCIPFVANVANPYAFAAVWNGFLDKRH